MGIKHVFVSTRDQSGDPTLVSKNEWNADHTYGSDASYIGTSSGGGNADNFAISYAPTAGNILVLTAGMNDQRLSLRKLVQTNVDWGRVMLAPSPAGTTVASCEIWVGYVQANPGSTIYGYWPGSNWQSAVVSEYAGLNGRVLTALGSAGQAENGSNGGAIPLFHCPFVPDGGVVVVGMKDGGGGGSIAGPVGLTEAWDYGDHAMAYGIGQPSSRLVGYPNTGTLSNHAASCLVVII